MYQALKVRLVGVPRCEILSTTKDTSMLNISMAGAIQTYSSPRQG